MSKEKFVIHCPKCKFEMYMDLEAKQRTQLLARVREEVIGGADIEYTMVDKPKETILKYSTRDNYYNPVRNQLRKEQLKNLKIISEEGKQMIKLLFKQNWILELRWPITLRRLRKLNLETLERLEGKELEKDK